VFVFAAFGEEIAFLFPGDVRFFIPQHHLLGQCAAVVL
jgi:hypothetical protein